MKGAAENRPCVRFDYIFLSLIALKLAYGGSGCKKKKFEIALLAPAKADGLSDADREVIFQRRESLSGCSWSNGTGSRGPGLLLSLEGVKIIGLRRSVFVKNKLDTAARVVILATL
jgi:hypothetical protein